MNKKMKILLISDNHHFSTKDMYDGYMWAFENLGIPVECIPIHELTSERELHHFSLEGAYGLSLAKLLNTLNEFTHCFIISGLITPDWFFKSKYDKKICVIASDDPHASKILEQNGEYIDYWFSNCKNLADKSKEDKIFYIPTATSGNLPTVSKKDIPDQFKSDIVFIGTIYDGRIKTLERVCNYVKENNLKLKIFGPLLNTPKDSIIREYAIEGILNNRETKLYYRGSNIVINIDRDVNWNPMEKDGNSLLDNIGEPYSINPRAYEIAGCRTLQLYINARQEAKDIFGDNIFYANEENIFKVLDEIFHTNVDILTEKLNNCYQTVIKNHTYVNRLNSIMEILKEEKNVE